MNRPIEKFVVQCGSYKEAADAIGVSVSSISCWMRSIRRISGINARKIDEYTNGEISLVSLLNHEENENDTEMRDV